MSDREIRRFARPGRARKNTWTKPARPPRSTTRPRSKSSTRAAKPPGKSAHRGRRAQGQVQPPAGRGAGKEEGRAGGQRAADGRQDEDLRGEAPGPGQGDRGLARAAPRRAQGQSSPNRPSRSASSTRPRSTRSRRRYQQEKAELEQRLERRPGSKSPNRCRNRATANGRTIYDWEGTDWEKWAAPKTVHLARALRRAAGRSEDDHRPVPAAAGAARGVFRAGEARASRGRRRC